MKRIGLIALLMFGSFQVLAQFTPYVGIDGHLRRMAFIDKASNDKFRANHPQLNLFCGLDFNDVIGIELGVKASKATKKAGAHEHSVKVRGFHAGLIGYLPMWTDTDLISSIGVTKLDSSFETKGSKSNHRVSSHCFSPRLMAGLQHNILEGLDTRLSISWESTSSLKTETVKPRNSLNYGIGLVKSF